MDDSSEEYSNALMAELGNEPEAPSEDAQDTSADETTDTSSDGGETPQEASGEDENQDGTSNEAEDEPETPQFATKQDIKDAMAEYNQAQTAKIDHVNNLRSLITLKIASNVSILSSSTELTSTGAVSSNGEEDTYANPSLFML